MLRGILKNIGRSNLPDAVDKLHEDTHIDVRLFDLMEHVQRLSSGLPTAVREPAVVVVGLLRLGWTAPGSTVPKALKTKK